MGPHSVTVFKGIVPFTFKSHILSFKNSIPWGVQGQHRFLSAFKKIKLWKEIQKEKKIIENYPGSKHEHVNSQSIVNIFLYYRW